MTNKLICQFYETSIKMLEIIEKLSLEEDMIDNQEYLDWKDKLNELSIDPDRQ
jgi:hypothetical protein